MIWNQDSQKPEYGANEQEMTLDEQSKAARSDEQPENARTKKRTTLMAFCALLALCLTIGMANCAASYKQPESIKDPSREQVKKAAKTNLNADKDKVDKESQKAGEEMNDESSGSSDATPAPEASDNGNSGRASGGSNGGNSNSDDGSISSNSGSESEPQHTHNWVAQTTVVHHDAQYQTIHHDAVYDYRSICNGCQADITGNVDAHMQDALLNGNTACGAYHTENVLVSPAWDEAVEVSPAWDETVTTGYHCSGCGATK